MAAERSRALTVSVFLCLLLPSNGAIYDYSDDASSSSSSSSSPDPGCRLWQQFYVKSFHCLTNRHPLLCWILASQLESLSCIEPCYKENAQHCEDKTSDCLVVPGLCEGGYKCCQTEEEEEEEDAEEGDQQRD